MAGSGAGLNYVNFYILGGDNPQDFLATNGIIGATAVSSPLSGYGTIGFNDSGWWATEGKGYSKWTFTLEQIGSTTLTGVAVSIYGSASPNVVATWKNAIQGARSPATFPTIMGAGTGSSLYNPNAAPISPNGMTDATGYVPGIAPQKSILIPGPSEQSGAGTTIANPLTVTNPIFISNVGLVGLRAVVTTDQTAGAFAVSVLGIP